MASMREPRITVLITGGRNYSDLAKVREVISALDPRPFAIIHGGATGADSLADQIAIELGISSLPYLAEWRKNRAAAGPIRNQQMIGAKPDLVIAFPGGRGTADCVRRARAAGIPVTEVKP